MQLPQAFRSSFRQFRLYPLYTFACAGTLALAVAAAMASFAVVKRAFFDAMPYRDDAELVSLLTRTESGTTAVSAHVFADLQASAPPLSEFVPMRPWGVTYVGEQVTERVPGVVVTPSFFTTLGVQPALGRAWSEGERDAVIVSWGFWQRALGGEAHVLGKRIRLEGVDRAIVGVMAQDFVTPYFPLSEVWAPLDVAALAAEPRGRRQLSILARRAPGVTQRQLESYLQLFTQQMQQKHPVVHGRQELIGEPLRKEMVGEASPALMGAGAGAALLLLIVCANIAGLSAARSVGLRQQFAIRTALGASRRQLLAQRVADSAVIAALGSAVGVWLAHFIVPALAAFQSQFLMRMAAITLDGPTTVLGFAAGVLTGVVAAVLPQSAVRDVCPADALRGARTASGGLRQTLTQSGLVVAQIAFALVLLVGAGLLVQTVRHLSTTSLGFDSERVSTFNVNLTGPRYATPAQHIAFEREVLAQLERVPGVKSAAASVGIPVIGGMGAALSIFGRSDESGLQEVAYMSFAPEFRAAMGMRLVAGRDLTLADNESAPRVTLINETMARRYWPDGDALGARVRLGPGTNDSPWITVVGVVADVRQHGPTREVLPTAFGSTHQYSWARRDFSVRTAGDRASLAADLRAVIRNVDPSLAVGNIRTMDELVSNQTGRHRLAMLALTFFGAVATVLCAFGLYAVVSLTSQMRRREYAIRMALGAQNASVRWMVLRQALVLGVTGVVLGVAMAAGGTRVLRALLHGVAPVDAATFSAACVAVLALAAVSAWLPARQAGRVDPVEALRSE